MSFHPPSLVFDKKVNIPGIFKLTLSVTDPTGCAADLTATALDAGVVEVAPRSATAVVSQVFTVSRLFKLGPSSTSIVLTIKGVGTDALGNPCTENGIITIPVEFKPGILGVTPADPMVLLFNQGDTSVRGNNPNYKVTNIGDDALACSVSTNATWFDLNGFFADCLPFPGESFDVSAFGNLGIIQSLSPGQYNGTLSIKNLTNGMGDTTRPVTLVVGFAGDTLVILPSTPVTCSSSGACNPASQNISTGNPASASQKVTVTSDKNWVDVAIQVFNPGGDASPDIRAIGDLQAPRATTASTTLASGDITTVNLALNSNVQGLVKGTHTATVSFTDTDTGTVLGVRTITLALEDDPFATANQSQKVVAPFWQAGPGTYSFLAVSHPSLAGMNSEIGVSLNAVTQTGTPYGPAAEFTLASGGTRKVFIVTTNNSAINSTNIPQASFIVGPTEDGANGQVVANPIASNPELQAGSAGAPGRGFPDVTLLNFWGAVVVQGTTTGFAMEFVGDGADSRAFNIALTSGLN